MNEILWGFTKFEIIQMLKISAFYLDKQKSFVAKLFRFVLYCAAYATKRHISLVLSCVKEKEYNAMLMMMFTTYRAITMIKPCINIKHTSNTRLLILKGKWIKRWPLFKHSLPVHTLPTAETLSGKNVRAWVSMVSYLKKQKKIKN